MALITLASRLLNEMNNELDWYYPHHMNNMKMLRAPFDLISKKDAYLVHLELPGMPKENIKIDIDENNVLHVTGERDLQLEPSDSTIYKGRSYGSFASSVTLPTDVDLESLDAQLNNGVLTVQIKKKPLVKPKTRQISIS